MELKEVLHFDEKNHKYTLEGPNYSRDLISVTQLMQKHGLAPSYAGVSTEVLNAKAERGSLIHKEIEDFNKKGEIGFTDEMAQYKAFIEKNNVRVKASELQLHNDIVAGTCDLILNYGDGCNVIADIKTTYTLHLESVSWQLSIYAYLTQNPTIKKGQAFHFNKDGKLNVVDIPLKPMEEIERLMECERNGEIYKYEVAINDDQIMEIAELEELIKTLDGQVKAAKQKQEELKSALLQEMEKRGLKSFEKGNLKITYVAPEKKEVIVDYEKMDKNIVLKYEEAKAKYDEEMEKYCTETKKPSKPYLKITLKGEK